MAVRIKIVGVGGGGNNAVERMLERNIPMVDYVTVSTDDGCFKSSHAQTKIQIGHRETKGRGAGADPEKGRRSAFESRKDIERVLKDCDMLFIAAGMGGGTGTGAAPVVAEVARDLGILTVAIVTTPFAFEGKRRMNNALEGISKLKQFVDATVTIPNDNLKLATKANVTLSNAFLVADNVLVETVKSLVEVIQNTASINCDFADICSVLCKSGDMYTATGIASGVDRTREIVEQVKTSVLQGKSIAGCDAVLLYITASGDVLLDEIEEIAEAIRVEVHPDANIIMGMNFDETMHDDVKVVLFATKKDAE